MCAGVCRRFKRTGRHRSNLFQAAYRRAYAALKRDNAAQKWGIRMTATTEHSVSPQNPCPFLRALVAEGLVNDAGEPVGQLATTICAIGRTGDGKPELPYAAIVLVALIANGLSPLQVARNASKVRINQLRGGPLDKKGVGSGVLDQSGQVDESQLDRMAGFGSEKHDSDGKAELGLNIAEITRFMEANLGRAQNPRRIDRRLMNGEWPFLLRVIGKKGQGGRYLSMADVRALVVERRLPERMRSQLPA
jgi:hypothetical protein